MEHRKINKPEHKGKKGLAAFLFSRIFIFVLWWHCRVGGVYGFGIQCFFK